MHRRTSMFILALVTVGCATLKPDADSGITDFKMIAGQWSGTGTRTDGLSGPWDVVIRENGTYESSSPLGTCTGTLTLKDGKVLSKNDQNGRTGVFRLAERRDGKPKLVFRSDDGISTGELQRLEKK